MHESEKSARKSCSLCSKYRSTREATTLMQRVEPREMVKIRRLHLNLRH